MPAHARRKPLRPLLAALLTTGVVSALVGSALSPAVAVDPDAPAGSERARAEAVLEEAESLFDGRPTPLAPGRDATMVLRDLMLARDSLTGEARLQADRLLARPTAEESACSATACFHWTTSGPDQVAPGYVDEVMEAVSHVQATYVAAGYRAVKPDGTKGGNSLPDIYLANIGPDGLYGYCTSDEQVPGEGPYDAWAYCVLDNDYAVSEFPTNTPLENMQVTAAHEYFHAVQYGYDAFEDAWFMEATATWAEDELYDDVDDNLNYFGTGPLAKPAVSLDTFSDGGYQYGAWIFFRYLTEQLPDEVGGMPSLIRDLWVKADGSAGGPDQYSMQALAGVLKVRGTSLPSMFAAFADANRRPATIYSEGAANGYPTAPLGKFARRLGWYVTSLDHMSTSTIRFEPTTGPKNVKVSLDLPPKAAGSAGIVSVYHADGQVDTSTFALNRKGNGSHTYPFDPASVRAVEITMVNASTKYDCWSDGRFSCQGTPRFDNTIARVKGVLVT
jgi:hypothetical protein